MNKLFVSLLLVLVLVSSAFSRGHRSYGSHSRSSYSGGGFRYSGSGRESRDTVHVHGYYRKNGTYVHAYDRTRADGTQRDNWSAKGNRNLETGKYGDVPVTH